MTANRPYLRRAELYIWPTTEQVTAADNIATKIVADGSRNHLRMSFVINKSIIGVPNSSQITLYNLSQQTRDIFRKPLLKCSLRVGWENYGLFEIFNGGLVAAVHNRQGPDIISRITMLTGITATATAITSRTFSAGTLLSTVLKTLVVELPGVKYDSSRIQILDGNIGFGGISFAGTTKDFLDKLALQYGFSWSIQDGIFQAIQDGSSFGRNLLISSESGTLFNVFPILNGPLQIQTGVTITALLVPNILPGDSVTLKSGVNSQLNGVYSAHTITYSGDTSGNEWNMCIQSFADLSAGASAHAPIYEVAK